jgi:hypothetical protein
MKFFITLFLLFSVQLFGQSINDYQYIIVPLKFGPFENENEYRLNTIAKLNLEKMGFTAFYENSSIPEDIRTDRCDFLTLDVVKENSVFGTKLKVLFKDCFGKIIHESNVGKSKEKEYKLSYRQALEDAFQSLFALDYKYNETKNTTKKVVIQTITVSTEEQKTSLTTPVSDTLDNSKLLFAQPTSNGYQLVDSTPKVVYKLFKTDSPSMFLAEKESINGVVTLKEGSWFFEYRENEKVVSEKLEIKF